MLTLLDLLIVAYFVGHFHVPTALWVIAVVNEIFCNRPPSRYELKEAIREAMKEAWQWKQQQ